MKHKFAVLGLGKTGQAMMTYLTYHNQEVIGWNRSADKVEAVNNNGINATGAIEGYFSAKATANIEDAIKDTKYMLVMTVANGHLDVAKALTGILREGQRIIVFNGNWGAYEFYGELKDEAKAKKVLISETSGMLILANLLGKNQCHLGTIKEEIKVASVPKEDVNILTQELKDVFPQLRAANNIADTSFNSSNPILHTPIALFNLARLENGEDYGFYTVATTPSIVRFVEAADRERVEVARAVGITPQSCLEILNSFWVNKYDNLYDAIVNNKDYQKVKGPKTLNFRYINEDLPYGIIPVVKLGKKYGVETPALNAMIEVFRFTLGEETMGGDGPDFDSLNLSTLL